VSQNEVRPTELGGADLQDGFGWARRSCFSYASEATGYPRGRVSASDRYVVFNSTHTIVFDLRDDGYLGYSGVTIVSVRERKRSSRIFRTLIPLGGYEMPNESDTGAVRHKQKGIMLNFVAMEGGAKIILTDIPKQRNSRSIRGELVLSEPEPVSGPAESIVCKQPWRNDGRAFRYSRCSPGLRWRESSSSALRRLSSRRAARGGFSTGTVACVPVRTPESGPPPAEWPAGGL